MKCYWNFNIQTGWGGRDRTWLGMEWNTYTLFSGSFYYPTILTRLRQTIQNLSLRKSIPRCLESKLMETWITGFCSKDILGCVKEAWSARVIFEESRWIRGRNTLFSCAVEKVKSRSRPGKVWKPGTFWSNQQKADLTVSATMPNGLTTMRSRMVTAR